MHKLLLLRSPNTKEVAGICFSTIFLTSIPSCASQRGVTSSTRKVSPLGKIQVYHYKEKTSQTFSNFFFFFVVVGFVSFVLNGK